jgi:hypothetical protein
VRVGRRVIPDFIIAHKYVLVLVLTVGHISTAILEIGAKMPSIQEQNKKERLSFLLIPNCLVRSIVFPNKPICQ